MPEQHSFFGGTFISLLRDWDSFVQLAYDLFGEDADHLQDHMRRHRLTTQQVLLYCNWTCGMTQEELAAQFQISQPAVSECLKRLKNKWPDLFRFTRPRNIFHYDPDKHDKHVMQRF